MNVGDNILIWTKTRLPTEGEGEKGNDYVHGSIVEVHPACVVIFVEHGNRSVVIPWHNILMAEVWPVEEDEERGDP